MKEMIDVDKAKFVFGLVTVVLLIGKFDYYVIELLIQVNVVFLENKICSTIYYMHLVPDYFQNLMPVTVGGFILLVVYFIARS